MSETNLPSIVFSIEDKSFSISSQYVESIIKLDTVTKLPNEPEYIKGIVKYRDKIYRVIDLRKLLGLSSIETKITDFTGLMSSRKQDHLNWLNELENSIKNRSEFKLTTDPTKCAFGKWYYNFKTDDVGLREYLNKFELPHSAIHNLAVKIKNLAAKNDFDSINKMIEETKNTTLKNLIDLFDHAIEFYKKSLAEFLIILQKDNFRTAFTVDEVLKVEYLNKIDKKDISDSLFTQLNNKLIIDMAKQENGELVVELSDEALVTVEI